MAQLVQRVGEALAGAGPAAILIKAGDASNPIITNAGMVAKHDLSWMVATDRGGPNHSKLNRDEVHPEVLSMVYVLKDVRRPSYVPVRGHGPRRRLNCHQDLLAPPHDRWRFAHPFPCRLRRKRARMTDLAGLRAQRQDLYHFIVRRTRDPAAADDLVQETLLRLMTYERARIVVDRAALGYRIALNLVRDHFRHRSRRAVEVLDDDIPCEAPAPEQILMHRQKVEVFGKALDAMPPLRRDVFIRRRLHGNSTRQIAAELSMNEAAVEKHVVRALEQLHREMAKAERRAGGRP